ncbi:MAG: glycoside hydrolase family 88 protein [Clostridia bacterium]|nr:glycoside hydrolase family 88 protein [Clostridia bacterium]
MNITESIKKAGEYIDNLTVKSNVNVPEKIIKEGGFFSWDNEKREIARQPYLFQWSYYNGVVFEGLYDIYCADGNEVYKDYVLSYLDELVGGDGKLIFERAGYVDYHGADCYKTAALLCRFAGQRPEFDSVLKELYRDLTDHAHENADGNVISQKFCDKGLGLNYWHSWRGGNPPKKYKLWLDGIYMLQPFLARYAERIGDSAQVEKIAGRIKWVCENMQAPNGLYYHATNGGGDNCNFFWLRALGWYGMAIADVAEPFAGKDDELSKHVIKVCSAALERFADGILKYQLKNGMWCNLADLPITPTNRDETSGTAMMVYCLLKGVRLGLLDSKYTQPAVKAFCGICENKLDGGLKDIYFKASANGTDNYQNPDDYLTDEGKGAGPFIMAYSEIIRL